MTFKDFSHDEVQMLCIQEIAAKRVNKQIVLLVSMNAYIAKNLGPTRKELKVIDFRGTAWHNRFVLELDRCIN